MKKILLAVLLLGCGSGPGGYTVEVNLPSDYGMTEDEVTVQVDAAIELGLALWGLDDRALDGFRIIATTEFECGGRVSRGGCAKLSEREIYLGVYAIGLAHCPAGAALHEIGHVALRGDPAHSDPRWETLNWTAGQIPGCH